MLLGDGVIVLLRSDVTGLTGGEYFINVFAVVVFWGERVFFVSRNRITFCLAGIKY